jgi:pyrroline-5-carboxylate reductase
MTSSTAMPERLTIIGVGRLGEALLSGLLRAAVIDPRRVHVTVRRTERATELAARYGVEASTDNAAAVRGADVVVLAVKPQTLGDVLDGIAGAVRPEQTVVSVAAGVTTATIERALGPIPVVRVMSNTPVLVDEAMSALAAGAHADEAHLALAERLLGAVGEVVRLDEVHLDAVTALSGSGPAYFFLLAEAMIDAGILLGLNRDTATRLIIQTMVGSAKMLRDTGQHPVELREGVTSPAGTTISAIRVLEQERVRAAFLNAIEAARDRSVELAGG